MIETKKPEKKKKTYKIDCCMFDSVCVCVRVLLNRHEYSIAWDCTLESCVLFDFI